jgi:hypothetical protein
MNRLKRTLRRVHHCKMWMKYSTKPLTIDKYISARVCVPQGDTFVYGTLSRGGKETVMGNSLGSHIRILCWTHQCMKWSLIGGDTEAYYHANIIAESFMPSWMMMATLL